MIKKERTEPIKLEKLKALIRRLLVSHQEYPSVERELAICKAGYRGEQTLDYYLDYLPPKEYYIFHDLRLFDSRSYFQIDTLVVSPYFILIVEVKNIAGKLRFDEIHQMVRSIDGREEGFQDPFTQLLWQSAKMGHWLNLHNFPHVPIDHLVVISNPSTIIDTTDYTPVKLTHSANLYFEIEALKKTYTEPSLTDVQYRKLSRILVKKHTPHNPDVMKQFKISPEDLLTGVHCAECKTLTMERKFGRWICSTCGFISGDAHFDALKDYFLLVQSTVSNRELKDFLQLQSSYVAQTLLKSMNLTSTGNTKGRRYKLPF